MLLDLQSSLVSRSFERSSYPIDSLLQVVDFSTDFRSNRINLYRKYDHPNLGTLKQSALRSLSPSPTTLRQVSFIRFRDLLAALTAQVRLEDGDDDSEDWETDLDDDQVAGAATISAEQKASRFLTSSLLMDGLEHAAAENNADAHFAIASLYRCGRPNGYLYEESLKGRIRNKVEQEWVDAYLLKRPRFEKYKHHLRHAATGGSRQAAAEFAEVFDDPEYCAMAERGTGPIDAKRMVKVATSLG